MSLSSRQRRLSVFLALPLLAPTANAATTYSFTGSTTNGPLFDRPGSSDPFTQDSRYSAQSFQVASNTTCRVISTQSFDGYLLLYNGPFNPNAPASNLVAQADDAPEFQYSTELADFQVAAHQVYTLVTTGYQQSNFGEFSNLIQCNGQVSTAGPSCASDDDELNITCLNKGRFATQVNSATADGIVTANVVPQGTDDSAIFWFFNPVNWELFVKVVDGCGVNNRFWVFVSALTDQQFQLQVTDSKTGQAKFYSNPQGQAFQTVLDTNAFAGCP